MNKDDSPEFVEFMKTLAYAQRLLSQATKSLTGFEGPVLAMFNRVIRKNPKGSMTNDEWMRHTARKLHEYLVKKEEDAIKHGMRGLK